MIRRIETLRTYFVGEETAITFAVGQLRQRKATIVRQGRDGEILSHAAVAVLGIELDPSATDVEHPARAYVSGGNWIWKCECGGAEGVDDVLLIGCCCSCWNSALEHRWRSIVMPIPEDRGQIERLLLARPDPNTRNWLPGESIAGLAIENEAHGL